MHPQDVPLREFAAGTLLGCMPQQFVAVRAGMTLATLKSLHDLTDLRVVAALFLAGCVVLLPSFLGHAAGKGGDPDAATAQESGPEEGKGPIAMGKLKSEVPATDR